MYKLLDYEIDRLIEEDVPYLDLTSHLLGIGEQPARITIFTREKGIACGTEEAEKIFGKLGIQVEGKVPSGARIHHGDILISGTGEAGSLHMAWKIAQNVLEYASGIATKTDRLLEEARVRNPRLMILATRKNFPGTKKLAMKGIISGGALPHRLGVSESVLVFRNHLNILGGLEGFLERLEDIRTLACEKKIIVETSDLEEAGLLAAAGVHGIQLDKVIFQEVREKLAALKVRYPGLTVLVAGGINDKNAESYSDPNVDGIVTSSLYYGKPLDLGCRIEPL